MSGNGALTLETIYGGTLVPVNRVVALLAKECDIEKVSDFAKAVEAAKRIDGQNYERKSYWGELAVFSSRRLGELIAQGQKEGTVESRGRPRKKGDTMSPFTLEQLGLDKKVSERSRRLAEIPEEKVREYISQQKEKKDDITKVGVMRFASNGSKKKKKPDELSLHDGLEAVNESIRKILAKWPKEFIETLGRKLVSMGNEIVDTGELA